MSDDLAVLEVADGQITPELLAAAKLLPVDAVEHLGRELGALVRAEVQREHDRLAERLPILRAALAPAAGPPNDVPAADEAHPHDSPPPELPPAEEEDVPAGPAEVADRRERLLAALADGEWTTIKALAEATRSSVKTVRNDLSHLRENHEVEHNGQRTQAARWRLRPKRLVRSNLIDKKAPENGNGHEASLEGRILGVLQVAELTVPQLVEKLDAQVDYKDVFAPQVVAEAVAKLMRENELMRLASGRYTMVAA